MGAQIYRGLCTALFNGQTMNVSESVIIRTIFRSSSLLHRYFLNVLRYRVIARSFCLLVFRAIKRRIITFALSHEECYSL